ncbi:MAG: quinone-dependent dihydroorotate dehydrogenase [Steroidobacteraceae bacterium]
MWYWAIRPALFALDAERAHRLALDALRLAGKRALRLRSGAPIECLGLRFPNRVGLAAGFDKNAVAVDGLGSLGFGFIEVGTVTPRAQPGQPRPRLFRLPAAGALINRLGFPNDGAEKVASRLRQRRYRGIVGVNIGKNADTPVARAIDDYVSCLRTVRNVADYLVVNVSSPNTIGLRELQSRERLEPLLTALLEERARGAAAAIHRLPLLVKISPDLSSNELRDIAALLKRLAIDGVIATNTTASSAGARLAPNAQAGGLSGRPLQPIAVRAVAQLRAYLGPRFPIVGVGGIDSSQAALAMRAAGADLIQLYTGLVYRGPSLVSNCIRALEMAEQTEV